MTEKMCHLFRDLWAKFVEYVRIKIFALDFDNIWKKHICQNRLLLKENFFSRYIQWNIELLDTKSKKYV